MLSRLDCYRGYTVIEAGLLSSLDCYRGGTVVEAGLLSRPNFYYADCALLEFDAGLVDRQNVYSFFAPKFRLLSPFAILKTHINEKISKMRDKYTTFFNSAPIFSFFLFYSTISIKLDFLGLNT